MPKSQRAKELAAQQKAAKQAAKIRRRESTDPSDWGRWRQMVYVFKLTAREDRKFVPLSLVAFLVPLIGGVVAAILTVSWFWGTLGLLIGLTLFLTVFTVRARRANFRRYAGQAGAAELAFRELPQRGKNWQVSLAITANRHQDVLHRVVGPPGVILVGEGQAGRVRQMLEAEAKKHQSVRQGLAVTCFVVGDAPNQVALDKLAKTIKKLPKTVEKSDLKDLKSRLQALDNARPRVPLPRGPMPNPKGARQALRGR
ncbi:MAG: DUF4191 domain-containing protein [Propionibacteriaceae bacterium]|jgi:hypothetical protein|nr:DUF4191 domain-containing protein [Propionibacteriaceae bacterium]